MSAKTFSLFDPELTREDLQSAEFATALTASFGIETRAAADRAVASGFAPATEVSAGERPQDMEISKGGLIRKSRVVIRNSASGKFSFVGLQQIRNASTFNVVGAKKSEKPKASSEFETPTRRVVGKHVSASKHKAE